MQRPIWLGLAAPVVVPGVVVEVVVVALVVVVGVVLGVVLAVVLMLLLLLLKDKSRIVYIQHRNMYIFGPYMWPCSRGDPQVERSSCFGLFEYIKRVFHLYVLIS